MWISLRRIGLLKGGVPRSQRKCRGTWERTWKGFKRTRKRQCKIGEQKPCFGRRPRKDLKRTERSQNENESENRIVGKGFEEERWKK